MAEYTIDTGMGPANPVEKPTQPQAPATPKSGGGLISQLAEANPVGKLLSAGKDAVGAVHQGLLGNIDVNQNGVSTKFNSDPLIQADNQASRLQLTPAGQAAQQATGEIADIEGPLASQAGEGVKQSGESLIKQGVQDSQFASQTREQELQQSNKFLEQAEKDLQISSQKATINPNQYLENMGVGQRTMTAIGLLLSGAGAGLTGQPNLANEMLQKNIQRDIEAQKQNYLNAYNQFLGSKTASQTALERAQAATAAQNMATLTVNTGAGVLLNGLQTQVSGLTAKQRAEILKNKILQDTVAAKQNIDNSYIGAATSNDTATINMYGNMARAASRFMNPGKATDRFSLNPRNQSTPLNEIPVPEPNPFLDTQPEVQQAPQPEEKPKDKETFLDKIGSALAGMG